MLYRGGKGRYQTEHQELWDQYAPPLGQAFTVQGELLRAIGNLESECYRNGNSNWDWGFRKHTNFLWKHLRDASVFDAEVRAETERDIERIRKGGELREGEDVFDRVTDRVVEWCQAHPELVKKPYNPKMDR